METSPIIRLFVHFSDFHIPRNSKSTLELEIHPVVFMSHIFDDGYTAQMGGPQFHVRRIPLWKTNFALPDVTSE